MKIGFIDMILIVLMFQLISLTPFLIFHKSSCRLSNRILAAFLFAKALCISNFLSFRLYEFFYLHFPHSFYFGSSFTLLWGPLLYLYTKSMVMKEFKFSPREFLHFVPSATHFTYLFFKYHRFGADMKRYLLDSGFLSNDYYVWYHYANQTLFILYTIASFILVLQYRRQIKQTYASIESIRLSWLLVVLIGFTLKWICDVWYSLLYSSGNADLPLAVSRMVLFLFINVMMYEGFKHPVLFCGVSFKLTSRKASLSETLREQYAEKLKAFMKVHKPYLNPDITLVELSEMLDMPPRSLSEVINLSFGQNFYDFINSYRIKESEQLLADPKPRFKTTLEILYEVGFNSKSSFHTAFKKNTGMTPTEFKRIHAN